LHLVITFLGAKRQDDVQLGARAFQDAGVLLGRRVVVRIAPGYGEGPHVNVRMNLGDQGRLRGLRGNRPDHNARNCHSRKRSNHDEAISKHQALPRRRQLFAEFEELLKAW